METRETMGKNQLPAFQGQTRSVAIITKSQYKTEIITDKLHHPWSIAFMPDGRMLVSEKRDSIRIVTNDGKVSDTIKEVPKVVFMGDAGLLDLETDPGFASNRTIYFAFVEQRKNGNGLSIAPSGITFYSGKLIPEWKGNLFVTALAGQHLARLVIKNKKVIGEERLLLDQHQRIRDVAEGPDGALWVVTDNDNRRLILISSGK